MDRAYRSSDGEQLEMMYGCGVGEKQTTTTTSEKEKSRQYDRHNYSICEQ
jgi:hypothetical protein